MKKLISIILVIAMCIPLLCSCSIIPMEIYISPKIGQPATYYIIYEHTFADGSTYRFGQGIDAYGNVYILDTTGEYLALAPESNDFHADGDLYMNTESGWQLTERTQEHSQNMGVAMQDFIYTYAKYNLHKYKCTVKKNANQTIAGRKCHSYSIKKFGEVNTPYDVTSTHDILIDTETGYCLKSYCTSKHSIKDDHNLGDQPYGFACVEFTTDPGNFSDWINKTAS